jgi:hypothetical protein
MIKGFVQENGAGVRFTYAFIIHVFGDRVGFESQPSGDVSRRPNFKLVIHLVIYRP